jgi:hypothetical protein
MRLQVLVVRHGVAAGFELHHVEDVKRQPRCFRQMPGERRFSAAGISEDRDSFHQTLYRHAFGRAAKTSSP